MIFKNYWFALFMISVSLLFACEANEMSKDAVINDSIDQEITSDQPEPSGENPTDADSNDENPVYLETLKVLFVGNSLTFSNDLPKLVKSEALFERINLKTEMIALPNYALIDHWEDGNVQERIRDNKYDFVIIQQGPSSQPYGREVLIEYGAKLKTLCDESNTSLVFFMVWPSRAYYHTFDGVIKNHRDAASINKALLAPVGEVWKEYFDKTGDFSYYGPDNFHPSLKGSQVAAKIIAETIF